MSGPDKHTVTACDSQGEGRASIFARVLRKILVFAGFTKPPAVAKSVRNLTLISPTDLFQLQANWSDRLLIFDLRSRRQLDDYPFAIWGALPTVNVDWRSLLAWVPPQNVVVLYGRDEQSTSRLFIPAVPSDIALCVLRGGLQAWHQAGMPVSSLHDQQRCPEI